MRKLLLLWLFPLFLSAQFTEIPSGGGGGGVSEAQVETIVQGAVPLKCVDAGANDTYTCTLDPVPATAADAPLIWFDPNTNNTGAATLDIGPGAALAIYQNVDGVDPDDDDLVANTPILLKYCAACNSAAGAWVYEDLAGAAKAITAGTACPGDGLPILDAGGVTSCIPASLSVLEFFIANPVVSAFYPQQKVLPNFAAHTVTSVDCVCIDVDEVCTVSLNFDPRDKTTPTVAGTDLHTSEIVADEDNTVVTSLLGDTTAALNEKWNLSISAVTGSPEYLQCYLNVEVD